MDKHVPSQRLRTLAYDSADNVLFTEDELDHLKVCSECFAIWTEFAGSLVCEDELVY